MHVQYVLQAVGDLFGPFRIQGIRPDRPQKRAFRAVFVRIIYVCNHFSHLHIKRPDFPLVNSFIRPKCPCDGIPVIRHGIVCRDKQVILVIHRTQVKVVFQVVHVIHIIVFNGRRHGGCRVGRQHRTVYGLIIHGRIDFVRHIHDTVACDVCLLYILLLYRHLKTGIIRHDIPIMRQRSQERQTLMVLQEDRNHIRRHLVPVSVRIP